MLRNHIISAYITKFCDIVIYCELQKIISPAADAAEETTVIGDKIVKVSES